MCRYIIWLLTGIGVLPGALLSIASLRARAALGDLKSREPVSQSLSFGRDPNLAAGSRPMRLHLSPSTWPAITTICGIGVLLVGSFFLLPADPQRLYPDGMSQIGPHVRAMFSSASAYSSVTISNPEHTYAVLLARRGSKIFLAVFQAPSTSTGRDFRAKAKDFLDKRSLSPKPGGVGGAGAEVYNQSSLEVETSADSKQAEELLRAMLTTVFGADELTALEFTRAGF